jgi:outer membrane immunogenic protein
MNFKLILAGVVIAASTPAFAADLAPAPVEPIAPIVVPFNWSGFYVGADIGYSWLNSNSDFAGAGIPSNSPDPTGVVGGVYVGYNVQFNQIVVGLEADVEATGVNGDDRSGAGLTSFTKLDENWQGSVRARVGYAFDNFLPYITGGVAFSDWDIRSGPIGGPFTKNSESFTGWTLGAGLEYAFTPNIIGRLEYRYTDYGDSSDRIAAFPTTNRVDLKDNTVRVGIAYKF